VFFRCSFFRYEVDLDEKISRIGFGCFSTVYKGTWRKCTVAIKVLATTTPRKVFTREIEIWKNLSHVNILELLGASSGAAWRMVKTLTC
jgi:abelson tyrosine-protein kinase 1